MKFNKPQHPKAIGELTEIIVLSRLKNEGNLILSKPHGDNAPYDLIMDINNKLYKIQIKTGRLRNGVILFDICSARSNMSHCYRKFYTQEMVDLFMAYCYETDEIYVVKNNDIISKYHICLRITDTTKNFQHKNISYAKDYLLKDFLAKIF